MQIQQLFGRLRGRGVELSRLLSVLFAIGVAGCAPSPVDSDAVSPAIQTYCAADALPDRMPSGSEWGSQKDASVIVKRDGPCWVKATSPESAGKAPIPHTLILNETQGLEIRQFSSDGKLLARAQRGGVIERALHVGNLTVIENAARSGSAVFLHIAIRPEVTPRAESETQLRWSPIHDVYASAIFDMSTNLVAAGALWVLIVLSCVLALALKRPLFALAGCSFLTNLQYLLGRTGGFSALGLPPEVFLFDGPLLLANFAMLILFFTRFCEFHRDLPKLAYALYGLTLILLVNSVLLLARPDSSLAYTTYEWLRLPAYVLILVGLLRAMWHRSSTAWLCFVGLVPDFVYLSEVG